MIRRRVIVFVAALAAVQGLSQDWVHRRLITSFFVNGQNHYVSPRGTALLTIGNDIYVNDFNIGGLVEPGPRYGYGLGISDDDTPVYYLNGKLYIGTEDMTYKTLGQSVKDAPAQRLRGGHYAYTALTHTYQAIYMDGKDVSTPVLGPGGQGVYVAAPNSSGQVLWAGSSAATGGRTDVFFEGKNLSSWLGPNRGSAPMGVSENGHIAWVGLSRPGASHRVFKDNVQLGFGYIRGFNAVGNVLWDSDHAYVDSKNLSGPYEVPGDWIHSYGITDSGYAVWVASNPSMGYGWDVYVNGYSPSMEVFGGVRQGIIGMEHSVSEQGHVGWTGRAKDEGFDHVYFDTTDITGMVYGDHRQSVVLAMGVNGHLLWAAESDLVPGAYDVILSTPPVPEPSPTLLLPALLATLLRGGRACRAYPKRSCGQPYRRAQAIMFRQGTALRMSFVTPPRDRAEWVKMNTSTPLRFSRFVMMPVCEIRLRDLFQK